MTMKDHQRLGRLELDFERLIVDVLLYSCRYISEKEISP